jgi:hypothetical protein
VVKFSYIVLALGGGIYLIPPLRRRFDDKIFRHLRNYNASLGQYSKFNTQEEFYELLGDLRIGATTFFQD